MSDALRRSMGSSRHQPGIQRLEKEGRPIGDDAQNPNTVDAVIDVDFDDIPTVTMRPSCRSSE
jgi:hypothetical protein